MTIIHINVSDDYGGAAKAAYRIHKGLKANNINSELWVQSKVKREDVTAPSTKTEKLISLLRPQIDKLPLRFTDSIGPFSLNWLPARKLVKKINQSNADIIHLHRINDGFLSIADLARIKKPILWTLHDSWPYTGGCHIVKNCTNYQSHCKFCPVLGSQKAKDLSYYVFKKKLRSYAKIGNMHIIGVSEWVADNARKSRLFIRNSTGVIGNPIDTEVFSPVEKSLAKSILNLSGDRKLILFGAVNAIVDENKGFQFLKEAFESLDPSLFALMIFGDESNKLQEALSHNVINLGRVADETTLKILYSAADVMVVPSIQESFGQTATEAMACGTPVVAFRTSGLLDIVNHQINGYLAEPFIASDLATGIKWVIENDAEGNLGKAARDKIQQNFSAGHITKKYIEAYRQLLAAAEGRI